MISIRNSLTELERSHQIRAAVLDCYVGAIKNIAHYAIDLDQEITASHRKYLENPGRRSRRRCAGGGGGEPCHLAGLLRDYRDKASQYLVNMREELAAPRALCRRSWIRWLKPTAITKRTSTPRLASCGRWPPPRVLRHWAP